MYLSIVQLSRTIRRTSSSTSSASAMTPRECGKVAALGSRHSLWRCGIALWPLHQIVLAQKGCPTTIQLSRLACKESRPPRHPLRRIEMGMRFDLRSDSDTPNTDHKLHRGVETFLCQEILHVASTVWTSPACERESNRIEPCEVRGAKTHISYDGEVLSTLDGGYLSELLQAFPSFTNVELYFASLGNMASFPAESDWLEERFIDTQERSPRD